MPMWVIKLLESDFSSRAGHAYIEIINFEIVALVHCRAVNN